LSEIVHPPDELIAEAASLLYLIGGMRPKHLVVVGGLVPPLLVPAAEDPHRGSADIDLSLSVAITTGETAEYSRSIEKAIEPYFELLEGGFRWRKKKGVAGLPVVIDFMAPELEATALEDGSLRLEDQVAAANTGARLRPYPLAAGRLIDDDAVSYSVEGVSLVYKQDTRADVSIRHAGRVGFLAAKADALDSRDESKDGYDVSWFCINAGDTDEVAQSVVDLPAFKAPYFQESVAKLAAAFRARDYPGPTGYATVRNPLLGPEDEAFERDRNAAFLAVSRLAEALRQRLWD
jgi:hypothetical protein